MNEDEAPLFFTVSEIHEAVANPRISSERVRCWLDRGGLIERRCGALLVPAERLATTFPEIYSRLIDDE